MRSKYPGWPVVSFEGCEHIASSQGCVPWPEQLQHLARWPATICLPPRYEDVVSAIRKCFRRLRDRCRVSISDACTVDAIQTCVSQLWALHVKDLKVPITWAHAEAARAWLKSHGLFASVFDHNLSSLGAFAQNWCLSMLVSCWISCITRALKLILLGQRAMLAPGGMFWVKWPTYPVSPTICGLLCTP